MQDSELQIQMEVEENELNIQMDAIDPEQSINLSTEDITVIAGNVDDVVVNGVSVVDHKIANINIKSINNESVVGTGNIDIPIITKVSQLTNDKGYIDKSVNNLTYYYTKSETDALLNDKADVSALADYATIIYVNSLIKNVNTSTDNATYSCNYIDNNFLTLETLPRYDGGNQ